MTACGVSGTSVIYQCKICKKLYTHRETVYNHLKYYCNVEPQYKCSQCDYKAKQKAVLRRHVKTKHSIKKCDICSYRTMLQLQLKNHVRLKHDYRYMCSQCGKKYLYSKSFNNHKRNLCGSELYFERNHCSYSTNNKSHLRRHIRSLHSEIFVVRDSL